MSLKATLVDGESKRSSLGAKPVENPIRLGAVGLGYRNLANVLPKALTYEEYELAAVCDKRPEVVEHAVSDLDAKHGVRVCGYTDCDQMISEQQLDAVAVLVDVDKQVPVACRAMEQGCHVMMEVPVAYSIEHCWELVTTVERTGKVFLLMEQLRYSGYIQAWRKIVQSGVIGKPLFVEGEYFDDKPDAFFQDGSGRFYTPQQAQDNPEARPTWRHVAPTIGYLPHELSPLLHVLEDRVVKVVGMSVRDRSYRYENVKRADIQVALMHTEKDSILRMAVAHTVPGISRGELGTHWHHIKGTEGVLEWNRSSKGQCLMWVDGWQLDEPLEVPWKVARADASEQVKTSGHGGVDYYPLACFADAVLRDMPLEFDVYKAVETAAPAIMAAASIEQGSMPLELPDFRPGPHRKPGRMPG